MVIPGPSGNSPVLQAVGTGAYNGIELAVDLVEAQIKANIATALQNVRAQRENPIVTTEPPREYFQYAEPAHVYRAPGVFTVAQDMDFRESLGQNHLNSSDRIMVAVVVEDRKKQLLVKKAYRYQAALMQCLHHVTLTTADGTLRLFSRVKRCQFSGIINLKDEKAPDAIFRQEMSLQLTVEHVENLE
jgi:hypothetical protein